jgi:hypothetical protein
MKAVMFGIVATFVMALVTSHPFWWTLFGVLVTVLLSMGGGGEPNPGAGGSDLDGGGE